MLHTIANWATDIAAIVTFLAIIIKPFRERLLGVESIREGNRCLLRSEIVRIYYRHLDDKTLKEYEFKLLESCYKAYKALGGNSFIDRIYGEMVRWTIIN